MIKSIIVTKIKIKIKYKIVLIIALLETTKTNFCIFASNKLATNKDINCDKLIPKIKPITKEIKPIITVSKKIIIQTLIFFIPNNRYNPNSFFLFLIKN